MRERAAVHGGAVEAGPEAGGGWRVARAARGGGVSLSVLLADDQPLLRMGFRMILEAQPDMTSRARPSDGAEAIERAAALQPDVVLMDVRMPGTDGIEATRAIVASGAATRVLILTTFDLDEYAFAALRAGASGFLLKDAPPGDLLSRHPRGGGRRRGRRAEPHAPAAGRLRAPAARRPGAAPRASARLDALTEREREVLRRRRRRALQRARSRRGSCVSEATVKTHVGRILAKLGLRDRVQAVILAYETGLVQAAQR